MRPKSSQSLNDRELLNRILDLLEAQAKQSKKPEKSDKSRVYDNKSIMALLNIKDKYLKMLRDKGYLGYSKCGDKYWYSQSDVDNFLRSFHYKAFADTSPQI